MQQLSSCNYHDECFFGKTLEPVQEDSWRTDSWDEIDKSIKMVATELQPVSSFRFYGSNEYSKLEPARIFRSTANRDYAACVTSAFVSWYSLAEIERSMKNSFPKHPKLVSPTLRSQMKAHVTLSLDLTSDSSWCLYSHEGAVFLDPGPTGPKTDTVRIYTADFFWACKFLEDTKFITGGKNPEIWDIATETKIRQFKEFDTYEVMSLAVSPYSTNEILGASESNYYLWDQRDSKNAAHFEFADESSNDVAWHTPNTFISATNTGVEVYDVRKMKKLTKVKMAEEDWTSYCVSSGFGRYLMYSCESRVYLADTIGGGKEIELTAGLDRSKFLMDKTISGLSVGGQTNSILCASSWDSRLYFISPFY